MSPAYRMKQSHSNSEFFTTRNDHHLVPPNQANDARPPSSFLPGRNTAGPIEATAACVEVGPQRQFFFCFRVVLIQSNQSQMEIDILMIVLSSLIEVLDAIEPFLDCRLGIFLRMFSNRQGKKAPVLLMGQWFDSHFRFLFILVDGWLDCSTCFGCNSPCWPKPRWCSGRLGQHNLKQHKSLIFPPLEVPAILETHGIWSF